MDYSLKFPVIVIKQRRYSARNADDKGLFRTPSVLRLFRRPDKVPDGREFAAGVEKGNGMSRRNRDMKQTVVRLRSGLLTRLGHKFWFNLRVGICVVLLIALAKLVSGGMFVASPFAFFVSVLWLLPFAAIGAAGFAVADEIRRRRR